MLVKDEALQARHAQASARAGYADRVNEATLNELARARIMEDGDLAPNNPARQLGRCLTPAEFEAQIVAPLGVPNLLFEVHPTNRNRRCMYQIRDGEKHLICVYENNPMPEMSIVTGVIKWVPDPAYVGEGGRPVERADLPASVRPVTVEQASILIAKGGVQHLSDELNKRIADVEPTHLGMLKIMTPGAEKIRGWRTVLVYMMQHGLVSPEQIRNVVADLDRASWAGYMNGDGSSLAKWLK
jgi:hypothetical protein